METLVTKTVAEIVADNYKTADVFKKYGVDFCCGGHASVTDVCGKKNINPADLERDLAEIEETASATNDFNQWKLDFLIEYILNVHHTYVSKNIPLIREYADKVAKVHGHHYNEVVEIKELFDEVAEELLLHMHKEENILFPFIRELLAAQDDNPIELDFPFGTIQNPINMMEMEHENAGNIFKQIALHSNNYTPPADACNTYIVLYAKLKEFEDDLHKHIHLENNILFPKAIKMSEAILAEH